MRAGNASHGSIGDILPVPMNARLRHDRALLTASEHELRERHVDESALQALAVLDVEVA
jgi:hypothetical protein